MPADRKQNSRRKNLSQYLDDFGRKMPSACSRCERLGTACRVGARSGRCGGCVRSGKKCDVKLSHAEFQKLGEERLKLEHQLEDAEEQLAKYMAKARRLRKQLRLAERKEGDAVDREMEALEAEEAEEAVPEIPPDDPPIEFPDNSFLGQQLMELPPDIWGLPSAECPLSWDSFVGGNGEGPSGS